MRQILLQNVTDIITKCDSFFITKCDRSLLQNASGFLLQNVTVLLQNATVTKCDDYNLLQLGDDPLLFLYYVNFVNWFKLDCSTCRATCIQPVQNKELTINNNKLLQIATTCYKMRRLLQIPTLQTFIEANKTIFLEGESPTLIPSKKDRSIKVEKKHYIISFCFCKVSKLPQR